MTKYLGGKSSVGGHSSPVVRPSLVGPDPLGYHGLDGECVAGLHHADGLVFGVVRHIGSTVEQFVDALNFNFSIKDLLLMILHLLPWPQ